MFSGRQDAGKRKSWGGVRKSHTLRLLYRGGSIGFTIRATQVISKETKFNEIIRRYYGPVFKHALRILGNVDQAEDATQDVFISIYRALDDYREENHMGAWIHRITVNNCVSLRRKASPHFISLEDAERHKEIVDSHSNPEELHIQDDTQTELARLVSTLPAREATATTLCFYEGKSTEEIASIMQLRPGTVAVVLHRGKLHLHKLLMSHEKEERK